MKFLYKIYSGYDGFRPAVMPDRVHNHRLRLGWKHYIDVVEKGWECWIYFHGPHTFDNGVYAKGFVDSIDLDKREAGLRIREYSTDTPITSEGTSARIAEAVSTRGQQVFIWPDEWAASGNCDLKQCKKRQCEDCSTWATLPLIEEGESKAPDRLRWSRYEGIVAGHWLVPTRCFETHILPAIKNLTMRFTAFKMGEAIYAYPFALSIFEQLRRRELLDYDYIVPIPLSPDKAETGEQHRTLELAKELGRLLAVPVLEMLSLSTSISKRRMLAHGFTAAQFEKRYREALQANIPDDAKRILLVDDVITKGSTTAQALKTIQALRPCISIVVATAGQMIVKEAVVHSRGFRLAG